ncbi:MAG TPA: ABC transporter permease [Candidatus Polarisedimenticolaceae bacterium]
MTRDLRDAARNLGAAPSSTAIAVATLAAAIGAAAATFGALDGILLRPLPYVDAARLVTVWESNARDPEGLVEVSWSNFADWREQNDVFSSIALMSSVNLDFTLTGSGEPSQVAGNVVTPDFFETLGIGAALGRTLREGDDRLDAPTVVVIGHGLWQRRYGSDPGIVGRAITLEGDPATIVGVLPPGFDFPDGAELWAALPPSDRADPNARAFRVYRAVARLAPGVSLETARAGMDRLAATLAASWPKENGGYGVRLVPMLDAVFGSARRALPLLQGAVVAVVLIACANVTHLLLGLSARRRRETAIRLALGAPPRRLARVALAEGALVALGGGALGLVVAAIGVRALRAFAPEDLPRVADVTMSGRVVLFAVAASLACALLAAAIPAWRALRAQPATVLREAAVRVLATPRGVRARRALVVSEVALAVVLAAGAVLLVRSALALERLDPGWSPRGVWTARVALVRARYPDRAAQAAFFTRLVERVRAIPGVDAAAAVLMRPLSGTVGWDYPHTVEGQDEAAFRSNPYANYLAVSPGYFDTVALTRIQGRDFTDEDRADTAPVVIVGESVAQRYWPGASPLGKRLKFGPPDSKQPWREVVGVVRDGRYREWGARRPDIYAPISQGGQYRSDFVVRTSLPPAAIDRAFREAVYALDPQQAVSLPATLETLVDRALARPRFHAVLLGAFASLAAALAAAGVYGVLGHAIAQRTAEIGVRMALGAPERRVFLGVVGEGVGLAALGSAIGLAVAFAGSGLLASLLHGVSRLDPLSLAGSGTAILLLAATASWRPARRASRIDPAAALREP